MFDIKMNYEDAIELGFDGMLNLLKEAYPKYQLYCISTDWFYNRQFIAKAKGINGDVIVGWNLP